MGHGGDSDTNHSWCLLQKPEKANWESEELKPSTGQHSEN